MSLKEVRLRGVVISSVLAGAMVLANPGCSSSSGANPDGGGSAPDDGGGLDDAPVVIHRGDTGATTPETGTGTGTGDATSGTDTGAIYDGTVGKACQSDADCFGGLGLNACSTSLPNAIWPTPVCINTMCNPGTDNLPHFCDGPDNSSSPGYCLAVTGGGVCLPKCVVAADGSAPTGCVGKDTCNIAAFGTSQSGQVVGIGVCLGGCTSDTDCPAGNKCQKDIGQCVTMVTPPTKALGTVCTSADNATLATPAKCSCQLPQQGTQGICTQSCIVGSAAGACPSGYVCDTGEPTQVTNPTTMAPVPAFATQNPGLAGICLPTAPSCGVDGGGGGSGDAGGGCPAPTVCTTGSAAGPDCAP